MVKRYKKDKAKADVLFSKIIRSQGLCEADGYGGRRCAGRLETAHIISRRYNAVRTDTRNAFCLCSGHHFWFGSHPREFSRFISDTWAQEYYDQIYQKSLSPAKFKDLDWQARIDFLTPAFKGETTIEELRRQEDD